MDTKPPHTLLPREAIAALQKAAATKTPAADPLARVKTIEKAVERVKRDHPHCFQTKEL